MQIKQPKFKDGKVYRPLTSKAKIKKLLKYLRKRLHKNHEGKVRIGEPMSYGCDYWDFVDLAAALYREYIKFREGTRGAAPSEDMAEQLICAPVAGINLTEEERRQIFDIIVDLLAPDCVAIGVWHIGIGDNNRDELHVAISSCLAVGDPMLRTSWLTRGSDNNYRWLLGKVEHRIVSELNAKRLEDGRELIPRKGDGKGERLAEKGHYAIPDRIAGGLGNKATNIDVDSVVKELKTQGWKTERVDDKVKIEPPEGFWIKPFGEHLNLRKKSKRKKSNQGRVDSGPREYDLEWLVVKARNSADAYQREKRKRIEREKEKLRLIAEKLKKDRVKEQEGGGRESGLER